MIVDHLSPSFYRIHCILNFAMSLTRRAKAVNRICGHLSKDVTLRLFCNPLITPRGTNDDAVSLRFHVSQDPTQRRVPCMFDAFFDSIQSIHVVRRRCGGVTQLSTVDTFGVRLSRFVSRISLKSHTVGTSPSLGSSQARWTTSIKSLFERS